MKTKRSTLIMLTVVGALLSASSALAAITPTSDDFSSDTTASWVNVGTTNATISYDSTSANDYDKNDWIDSTGNALDGDNVVSNLVGDTEATGDGVLGDGGMLFDPVDTNAANEAIGLTIGGTMDKGDNITLIMGWYNDSGNYYQGKIQLYNLTDGMVLVETANTSINGTNHGDYKPLDWTLSYLATESDDGDTLQIRLVENIGDGGVGGTANRNNYVDNFTITSTPETLYAYEGFDTASATGTDVTTVDVTGSGFSYTNTHASMDLEDGLTYADSSGNTLLTTGKSGGMDVLVAGTHNLQLDLASSIINSGQTIYFSFLTDITAVSSWGVQIGLVDAFETTGGSPTQELEAGFRSTSSNWGIYGDLNGIDARTGPATGTGQFLVISELNLDTGVMTTYLNPTNLTDVANTATYTLTDTATATLDTIQGFVFSLGGDEAGTVDEIRIGNTLDVVVPLDIPIVPTLYAYEGFNTASATGTDVTTVDVTGSGFSYTNTSSHMDIENGLTYSDSSGNDLVTTGKSGGLDAVVSGTQNLWLDLSSPIANSGQTLYFSFLTDVTAVDSFGVQIGLVDTYDTDSASPTQELEAGFRSTSSNWGIYGDLNGIDARTGPATGTGQFLVISELNLDTGVMTTYLDPTNLNDVANSAAYTLTDTATATLNTIQGFVFSLGGQEAGTIDEIRIGNTLDVVVPTVASVVPVLYAYEGFDRPLNNGVIYSELTGSGFTEITNSNYRFIFAEGLSYTDGNSNTLLSVGNASGITPAAGGTQNMQLSFPEITSGKLYVSFITDVLSVTTWGVTLGLQDSQVDGSASVSPNSTLEAGIRSTSNANSGWGLFNDNGLDERTATGPLGLSFIVMEVDIDNDTVVAWINPTDLTDVQGTSTELTDGGDTYTVGAVSSFLFSLAGDEAGMIDEIRIGNTIATVTPLSSGISLYDDWAEANGVGGSTENDDGDAQNNGIEYVLGSNPNNASDTGSFEGRLDLDASGYIFPARNDDSLDVKVLTTTNLVDDSWTTNTYNASNNDGGIGFQTNMISLSEAQLFIKALVE